MRADRAGLHPVRAKGGSPRPAAGPHQEAPAALPPLGHFWAAVMKGGLRLTPLRRRIIRLMHSEARPLGSYWIAGTLADRGRGSRHAYSTYRALNDLSDIGVVICLASRSRYMLSPEPGSCDWAVNLCRQCGSATPLRLTAAFDALTALCREVRFVPERRHIEIIGLCAGCRRR